MCGDSFAPKWVPETSDVPQGSMLRCLLFIIFINNLPSALGSCVPYLFADDTKCCKTILSPSDSSLFQHDLDSRSHWCQDNHLSFNASKCCVLQFTNRAVSPVPGSYYLDSIQLHNTNSCKDLGVFFSSDLSCCSHYHAITAKAYQTLGLICRTFSSLIPCSQSQQVVVLSSCTFSPYVLLADVETSPAEGHCFSRKSTKACY